MIDSPRLLLEETRNNTFNVESFNVLGLNVFQGLDTEVSINSKSLKK